MGLGEVRGHGGEGREGTQRLPHITSPHAGPPCARSPQVSQGMAIASGAEGDGGDGGEGYAGEGEGEEL